MRRLLKSSKNRQQEELFVINKKERTFIYIILMILLLIWCVPVYSLIHNSLKVNGIANYTYVMTNKVNGVPFWLYFFNSGINALGSSLIVIVICGLSGFAFSKIPFTGHKVIFNLMIMFLAISGPVFIIPFYFILQKIHLYNTHLGIIMCEAAVTIPFGLLMIKNYFDGLPETLMESARIDGAGYGQIFRYIYMPLAKPAFINLGVLQLMWSLQDFFFPLMFLTKEKLYTTTVAVNSLKGAYGMTPQNLGRYNAALVLISIPAILIFVVMQKYIMNGIVSGSVKE